MKTDKILLAHGSGGQLGNELIEELFLPILGNPILNRLNDQGVFEINSTRFAFTTDSYVVNPIFFPGGNIGELAVYGTVNDLSVGGAKPLYLSLGLIIEEGFLIGELKRILNSIKEAALRSQVQIITGDTKVVNQGAVDRIFINTAGVGIVEIDQDISADKLQLGDRIILSGTIGDHGMTIIAVREGLIFENPLKSDSAPLNKLVSEMLQTGVAIHAMRDPTRGGLASTLNEFARRSAVGIVIDEAKLPIRGEVREACEILGIDPLHVANEGKLVAVVPREGAEQVLRTMRKNSLGKMAGIIGEVTGEHKGKVIMKTRIGTTKVIDMMVGEQLPRIC